MRSDEAMIFSWWTALLAFLGLVPKAVEAGERAAEEKRERRDLEESARILAEAEAADAEHKRSHGE